MFGERSYSTRCCDKKAETSAIDKALQTRGDLAPRYSFLSECDGLDFVSKRTKGRQPHEMSASRYYAELERDSRNETALEEQQTCFCNELFSSASETDFDAIGSTVRRLKADVKTVNHVVEEYGNCDVPEDSPTYGGAPRDNSEPEQPNEIAATLFSPSKWNYMTPESKEIRTVVLGVQDDLVPCFWNRNEKKGTVVHDVADTNLSTGHVRILTRPSKLRDAKRSIFATTPTSSTRKNPVPTNIFGNIESD